MADQPLLNVSTSVQQGTDGKHWVVLHINFPGCAFAYTLHPDHAETLANELPDMLHQTIKNARLANGGLVVTNQLPQKKRS